MVIRFQQVTYQYNSFVRTDAFSLKNISLSIKGGEFILLAGQTGSGKTTFLRLLDTLILPTTGEIDFADNIVDSRSSEKKLIALRKQVGLVFQFPQRQLFSSTVLEDVSFAALNFGYSRQTAKNKAEHALSQIGVDESLWQRSVFNLSVGQMRKVAIAGVLINQPKYLLLDEPTAGMDDYSKKDLLKILKQYHENGATVIVVSHDIDTFASLADRMLLFSAGQILYDDKPINIFKKHIEAYLQLPTSLVFARALGLQSTPLSINALIEAINE
ncbi:ATP-binding cassette domain-containing protein [Oenococcus sicerae]|uniref:ATP-binding cassette domain-containing protein n=1 Tax=Oenococcus sicerae TaxID=2203724 RepID=A0AAJ1RCC6_9LACO|nr:ATP-binding cassette domain-containing protein [Oenococcus sicerae]MDN6901033.1 ATP-binding cassette domain-containing protein [Oenococcus sicerae]